MNTWKLNGYIIVSGTEAKEVAIFKIGSISFSPNFCTFTVNSFTPNSALFTNGENLTVSYVPPSISASDYEVIYKNGSGDLVGDPSFQYDTLTGLALEGDLTVDGAGTSSPTLKVDATNHRVGIGTSSPTEKLDVDGNIALTGSVIFEGVTANTYETTLSVTDPTADRTITLPNATGTVALTTNVRDAEMRFLMEVI
jgi:hypothetical protein